MNLAYEEFIDFLAKGATTQEVIDFKPSQLAKSQVFELLQKKKSDALTSYESAELDVCMLIEHLMRLAKARAMINLDNS